MQAPLSKGVTTSCKLTCFEQRRIFTSLCTRQNAWIISSADAMNQHNQWVEMRIDFRLILENCERNPQSWSVHTLCGLDTEVSCKDRLIMIETSPSQMLVASMHVQRIITKRKECANSSDRSLAKHFKECRKGIVTAEGALCECIWDRFPALLRTMRNTGTVRKDTDTF